MDGNMVPVRHWHEGDMFLLERYSNLQPTTSSGAKVIEESYAGMIEEGRRSHEQRLSEWERKIEQHPEGRLVLDGLDAKQRKQLSALLVDTCRDLQTYASYRAERRRATGIANEADRRQKMLDRKLRHASKALQDLSRYARKLDRVLGARYEQAAEDCLKTLRDLRPLQPPDTGAKYRNALTGLKLYHPCPEDPNSSAMAEFFWFFRHECQLPANEAEVRTAKIRNAFWTEWVPKVKFNPEDQYPGKSKGCSAVRQAIRRYRPEPRTSG